MRALAQRLTSPYGSRPGSGRTIGRATAFLAIGAGLIHVSAAVQHSEIVVMMVGFEVDAVLQVLLGALLILGRPSRPVLAGGIALMAVSVALWVISRTVGLGFLVDGTHTEPVGFKDGVTVLFELLAIAGLAILLEPSRMRARIPARWLVTPRLGTAAAVACALFLSAMVAGGHKHAVTHVASLHGLSGDSPHAGGVHAGGSVGGGEHRRRHGDGAGGDHERGHADGHASHPGAGTPAHASHATALAVAHSHGAAGAVAPAHDHALASGPGVVAGAGHEHAEGGTTTGGGGVDHGGHPPGHDPGSGYGEAPAEPAPPPEEPDPVGDVNDEVDKLVP